MNYRFGAGATVAVFFLILPLALSHVCYQAGFRKFLVTEYRRESSTHGYTCKCGWKGWGRCRCTRIAYFTTTFNKYIQESYMKSACCSTHTGQYPNCIQVCNPICQNGGTCHYSPIKHENYCQCPPGFEGDHCQLDINECKNSNICRSPAVCSNTVGSYDCICPDGFRLGYDKRTCVDIDECTNQESHECGSTGICQNTKGSYICHCGQGYKTLPGVHNACYDIDECAEELDGCQQICVNKPGYYRCSCNEGYTRNLINLRKCDDINECETGTDNCTQRCENTLGSFKCSCTLGCKLANDEVSCEDIDECNDTLANACDHNCTNLPCQNGRYSCSCHPGYSLHANNHTCIDFNECSANNGGCQHYCNNTVGSYYCSCPKGYRLAKDLLNCEELPCPNLTAPVNGDIQCSHNPLVVGSTCSFTCNEEYNLIGSSVRQCLTDTTWNGSITDCKVKHCPQLQLSPNAVQVWSCDSSINSTCPFVCKDGYFIDSGDTTYSQACAMTEGIAQWTLPKICKEASACNLDTCVHGSCYASDTNTPHCVCLDGYYGDTCDTLSVKISKLPLLNVNEVSPPVNISTFPQSIVTIMINTVPPVDVSPSNQIAVSYPNTITNFYLQSSVQSFIRLQFSVSGDDEKTSTIEDMVTIASDAKVVGTYFRGQSTNTLTEGCCKRDTDLATRFCTRRPKNSISFSSSCSWTVNSETEYQSNGIIFLSVGTQSLPVSIIGLKLQVSDEGVSMDFTQPGLSCSSCASSDCNSSPPQTIQDIRDMVKRQSMISTFLSAVEPILPKHISIKPYGASTTMHYSKSSYYTKILPAHELQSSLECPNLLNEDTDTDLYYTITTGTDLQFVYNNDQQLYYSTESVCFAYSLCNDSTLFVSVPPKLSKQMQNLSIFDNLLQKDWNVEIKSITISRYGLSSGQSFTYWDGNGYFAITQSNYKLITKISITGGFKEEYLQVYFNFNGTVTEATDKTLCEAVSQRVNGNVSLEILTGLITSQQHSVLHLGTNNGHGLYLTNGCGNGPMPGLAIDLYLFPLLTNGSYSKYIHLKTMEPCLVKSHFQFDSFSHINNVSLLSSCIALRVGELEFTDLPLKFTLYPDVIQTIPNRITTVLLESRISSATTIGNFFTILPNPTSIDPDLQSILFSDGDDIICWLPTVNISLFDTHITTPVQITEQGLQFFSSLSLFHIGTTSVMGQGGTDRPWDSLQLMLQVVFTSDFASDLTSYLHTQLHSEIEDTLLHIDSANDAYVSAVKRVSELEQKLMRVLNRQNNFQRSYNAKEKKRDDLENYCNQHEKILYHLLETYWNATDKLSESIESICQIEECDRVCKSGIVHNFCFVPVKTINVPVECTIYVIDFNHVYYIDEVQNVILQCEERKNTFWQTIGVAVTFGLYNAKNGVHCTEQKVVDKEWRPAKTYYKKLEKTTCLNSSVETYGTQICDYNSTCALLTVDPVCNARNKQCHDNRTNIITDFKEENEELRVNIRIIQEDYEEALMQLVYLSSEIAILKLGNISATQEIEATKIIIQSAQESVKIANQSLQSIKTSNSRIAEFNDALEDIESIVKVTNVYFDVTLESRTPVIVPLKVVYEIPQLTTSHEVRIVADISANEDLIKKTIYDNIIDDIIDNVIGDSSRQRRNAIRHGTVSLVDIFKDNCDLQKFIINYLEQLNQSLSAVQDDITDAISVINITRNNETVNHIATVEALRTVGNNLSIAMLVNERKLYATQMEGFDLVVSEITDNKLSQWKAGLDEIHNKTSNLFGQTCYSLIDCLSTSVINVRKLVSSLQAFNTSEIIDNLKDARKTVQELTNNTSWTVDDIQYAVNKVYMLAIEVAEDGYWCATPPVLLKQPPSDIEKFVGNSLTLTCPSSSRLPVTYSWYKNRKSIPFATSSSLFLPFLTRADNGLYQCEVKNAIGITKSNPALLHVYKRVKITKEPESVKAVANEDVYFTCGADGYPLPKYQWMYRKSSDDTWTMVDGVKEELLIINNISYADEGQYRCKAINDYSTAYSRQVSLTLLPGTYPKLSYNFSLSFNKVHNTTLISPLKDSFITAIGDLININLTPVHLTSAIITNNQLMISFVLFSSNYSIQSEADFYEAWFNQTITDLGQLQANKMILDSSLRNNTHPFTIGNSSTKYFVNGKINIGPLVLDCPHGYQFDVSNLVCVGCDKGSYQYNTYAQDSIHQRPGVILKYKYPVCSLCPRGSYQQNKASALCNSCPKHYSTVEKGSTSAKDCKALCAPGTYSDTGFKPCQNCAISHHQILYGSRFCLPCSKGSSIPTCIKARCKENHYSSTGYEPCQPCSKGQYQPSSGQTECLNCTKISTNIRCLPDCHLPPFTGPCNNSFQRYFYNKTSRLCETFLFGGCNANNNNFYYQYDCENKCGECPPTCSFEFCILNRFNICSMSPVPQSNNSCPGNCRLSTCQAYYYAPDILPHPKGSESCGNCDGQEMNTVCMTNWGICLRTANIQSPDYAYHPLTPNNFHCWEYNCGKV